MRFLLCGFAALVLAVPALGADDKPKPNALTPQEIADGWILLFDGETTFGWNIEGKVTVTDGCMALGGEKGTDAVATIGLTHFELRFEYRAGGPDDIYLALRSGTRQAAGHPLQRNDREWNRAIATFEFHPATGQYESELAVIHPSGTARGRVARKIFDDMTGLTKVGLRVPVDNKLVLRNVKLKPLGLKPLFTGKDLTGWKEFKGDKFKSKFTVTEKGELNIKDGPGDVQTEGQYDDFVLQLECISNGQHLNSGVFFRCRPNEYQQGYEAQIRNQFTDEPMQEYTLEEYDPETHELKGTKKVKYQAVDYGTGAIYRRQPARRPVAKDGEWFTMTLVAHGNHFAVWVNGLQVTDWTDNRPLKDNARNGCYLQKGHISFQGHDPTTDLSFRNIRIAELPRAAEK